MKSPIDFTLLCDRTEGYAVHCSTEEDANTFLEWVKCLYPGWCGAWADGRNNYSTHGEDTVYTFDLRDGNGGWKKSGLLYGDKSVSNIGYKIIEFAEIYKPVELTESDQPIAFLLT